MLQQQAAAAGRAPCRARHRHDSLCRTCRMPAHECCSRRLEVVARHVSPANPPTHCVSCSLAAASAAAAVGGSHGPEGRTLTQKEKTTLYHNGFVIVKQAVSPHLVRYMHDAIENGPVSSITGRHLPPADISRLIFDSDLRSILVDLNGPDAIERQEDWMWQPAYLPPAEEDAATLLPPQECAGGLHVDGRRAIGGKGARCCDAKKRVSMKPFQSQVFVSVCDLSQPGFGQTHILPGAHIAMEEYFKWQLATHDHVGSLGPGWNFDADPLRGLELTRERESFQEKGGHRGIPTMVAQYFTEREALSAVRDSDGERVPKPVPILLGPGDACLTTFTLPHAVSRNQRRQERKQTIFRLKLPGVGVSIPGAFSPPAGSFNVPSEHVLEMTEFSLMSADGFCIEI